MAFGPAAGLELVDALTSEPSLESYHLLPSVRGDLLAKLGRFDEARAEFERAASLTRNAPRAQAAPRARRGLRRRIGRRSSGRIGRTNSSVICSLCTRCSFPAWSSKYSAVAVSADSVTMAKPYIIDVTRY